MAMLLTLVCTGVVLAEEVSQPKDTASPKQPTMETAVGTSVTSSENAGETKQEKTEVSKFRMGIGDIQYKAARSERDKDRQAYGNRTPDEDTRAFIDMLTTSIAKTRKFEVIERDRMADILKEQAIGDYGLVEKETAQKMGTIKGVDFIVLGGITEYGFQSKGGGVAGFDAASAKAVMAVDVRIVNAETGKLVIAETVSQEKKAASAVKIAPSIVGRVIPSGGQTGGASFAENNEKVLSDVMRDCADSIANLIVSTIYPIKIISVGSDGTIMLNYGSGFMNKDEILDVFSQGQEVIDPDTKEVLGKEEQKAGMIKITDVQAKFSKSVAIEGADKLSKGMVCRKLPKEQMEKAANTKAHDEKQKKLKKSGLD